MSKRKRRDFSPEFKARVCIEVLKEEKSLGEIASAYEIHPNVLRKWKKEFLEKSSQIFANGNKKNNTEEPNVDELYKQIGQLKVENEWFKKKLKPLGLV
jgi:transposase-like protein